MNKVYVYIEYCDSDAFGERIVEVFSSKKKATDYLRYRMETTYGFPWEELPEQLGVTEDDTFTPEYVSICNGDETRFWIVEEQTVDNAKIKTEKISTAGELMKALSELTDKKPLRFKLGDNIIVPETVLFSVVDEIYIIYAYKLYVNEEPVNDSSQLLDHMECEATDRCWGDSPYCDCSDASLFADCTLGIVLDADNDNDTVRNVTSVHIEEDSIIFELE